MGDFRTRLEQFLAAKGEPLHIEQLTPDASTREYFRVLRGETSAIACVYAENDRAAAEAYVDVTELFVQCGLPVAAIIDADLEQGIIIQEDLGDVVLRSRIAAADDEERQRLTDEAIALIPKIQAATDEAFRRGSIASKLKFDVEKLSWELNFFKTHYFTTLRRIDVPTGLSTAVEAEFLRLSAELERRASVLCHRDFHAANLMIDPHGRLRIIDHQDARIGSAAYDLVSFLLDRVERPPDESWIDEKKAVFHQERSHLGLADNSGDAFDREFRLQTVQRCLKAVGTFSFQSANRGKTYFLPFIAPMFKIVSRSLAELDEFPALAELVSLGERTS